MTTTPRPWPPRGGNRPVHIVAGPPGSGKSTYVRQRAGPGDLIWDMDLIAAAMTRTHPHDDHEAILRTLLAMRESFIQTVAARRGTWKICWFITSSPSDESLNYFKTKMRADLIIMPATLEECLARIDADETRTDKLRDRNLVYAWFNERGRGIGAEEAHQ